MRCHQRRKLLADSNPFPFKEYKWRSCVPQETGWSMEAAIEYYYNMDPGQIARLTPQQQQPSLSREAVDQLFNRYRDQHSDAILAEGVGRLCDDLEVMLLSHHLTMAILQRPECQKRASENKNKPKHAMRADSVANVTCTAVRAPFLSGPDTLLGSQSSRCQASIAVMHMQQACMCICMLQSAG